MSISPERVYNAKVPSGYFFLYFSADVTQEYYIDDYAMRGHAPSICAWLDAYGTCHEHTIY